MGVKGWNVAVLVAIGALWFCGTTQREKPVVGDSTHTGRIGELELKVAANPNDPSALRELGQAYIDVRQPGMAIGAVERAVPAVRNKPIVEHLYARALLEQGRSADALAAEKRVLTKCADPSADVPACSTYLIASATRRAEIIEQLVQLGVEDANAQPEASSLAYHNATRQVSLSVSAH
jgi:predicted Zn-dependent protease